MARNVKFSFLRGGGSSLEVLYGKVSLTPTNLHTLSSTAVLPAPTTFDLVNGTALATNVAPTPAPVDGLLPWGYKVKITDNFGKSWEYLVGVPDGTTEINFNVLPKYFETRPPVFGVGPTGPAGQSASVAVGTVSSGPSPTVVNSGTSTNAILNFTLAKGVKGDKGEPGVSSVDWANAAANSAAAAEASKQAAIAASQLVDAPSDEVVRGLVASPTTLTYGSVRNAVRDVVSDVSPESTTDEAVKSLIETEGTQTKTALSAAIVNSSSEIMAKNSIENQPAPVSGLTRLHDGLRARNVRTCRIVFTGSSTTDGENATSEDKEYVHILGRMIQREFPSITGSEIPVGSRLREYSPSNLPGVQIVTLGLAGASTASYLPATFMTRIANLQPAMVVHMVGSNDQVQGMAPATYKANLIAKMDQIDAAQTRPCVHVLVHQFSRRTPGTAYPFTAYRDVQRDLASQFPSRVAHIDLAPDFEIIGVPSPDPYGVMATDGVHVMDAGHAYIAELMFKYLGISSTISNAHPNLESAATRKVITSDTFTGDAVNATTRATDCVLGGTPITPTSAYSNWSVSGGKMVVSGFGPLDYPHAKQDVEVSVKILTMATGSAWYLTARRVGTAGSRAKIAVNGQVVLLINNGFGDAEQGVSHTLVAGDVLTVSSIGNYHTLKINGVVKEVAFLDGVSPSTGSRFTPEGAGMASLTLDDFKITELVPA